MGKQDKRASNAAKFSVACSKNAATKILLPAAMRAKGYSDVESNNKTLWQQVRREASKREAADSQTNVVASSNASTSAPDVVTTSVNPPPAAEASSVAPDLDPIKIPSPMKKVRRTSRQVQVDRQNQRKQKEINSQAHMRA
jgi:hypothetical protein